MLSGTDVGRITKEILLKQPLSINSDEARAMRAELEIELAQMKADGIVPDIPYDFD